MMLGTLLPTLAFALSSQILLPDLDPHVHWQTLKTEHFQIHFDPHNSDTAAALRDRAEVIYHKLTNKFHWEPATPVHLVVNDTSDDANGLSTPIPYNTIYLYIEPPLEDSALDTYDDWLTTLLTHEFTHTVHLEMTRGLAKIPRYVLGRVWLPNAIQQQWGIEGLAEYEETVETKGGRGRSAFVNMYLRTVALENQFSPIDRATYWNDIYPYGNTAYWYGIGFHEYLVDHYGEDKLIQWTDRSSRSIIPSFFNFKTRDVYGTSFTRLWKDWELDTKKRVSDWKAKSSFTSPGEVIDGINPSETLLTRPAWCPDGDCFYAILSDGSNRVKIWKFGRKPKSPESWERPVVIENRLPNSLFATKDLLVYSADNKATRYRASYDVFVFDLKRNKEFRLTRGMRLTDPILTKDDEIIAIRTDDLKSSIVKFRLPDLKSSFHPIEKAEELEVLFEGYGRDTFSKPSISRDGRTLLFSMHVTNHNRGIYSLDLKTKKLTTYLADDSKEFHHPIFSADGNSILFSSPDLEKNDSERSPSLYSWNLTTHRLSLITHLATGAYWPVPSPNSDEILYGEFHSNGFQLRRTHFHESPKGGTVLAPSKPLKLQPEEAPAPVKSEPYSVGDTLWPRFLLPFYFYTETDSAIGLRSASWDPLAFHQWSAIAYQMFGPNRPGGEIDYVYSGWKPFNLITGASAGISDYGQILITLGSDGKLHPVTDNYYERNYYGYLGGDLELWNPNWHWVSEVFGEHREALLGVPTGTLSGMGSVTVNGTRVYNVQLGPEHGNQWGVFTSFLWATPATGDIDAVAPERGHRVSLSLEYTPDGAGSDFESLTTILSGKKYFELWRDHTLALSAAGGLQWLKPIYQRSFLLGGSFGEGPFSSINKRSYSLRGLDYGAISGEGIIDSSAEFRFPITKNLPGFGTAPAWFKNISGTVFFDGGQAFDWKDTINLIEAVQNLGPMKFKWNGWTASAGGELRTDVSLSYAPPLTFRAGYGYVLYLKGNWIGNTRTGQFYLQAGTSF